MKKLYIIFITSLISVTISFSQPCLPDGITFSTQAQIDSFPINYPNCSEIGGNVSFKYLVLSDLSGLTGLKKINGNLTIQITEYLTNLSGLDSLYLISGNLKITENNGLTSFSGLENLDSIGGELWLSNNNLITNFSGMNNIKFIGKNVKVQSHDQLIDLSGFENLTTINGSLTINGNENLLELNGLQNVNYIDGNLRLRANISLTDLHELINLDSINGQLSLYDNIYITSLVGLDSLLKVNGDFYIGSQFYISDLLALSSLYYIGGDLIITNNWDLTVCDINAICNYLTNPVGDILIYDNAQGCDNVEEVEEACLVDINSINILTQFSVYPNPLTTSTTIEYQLDQSSEVTLTIFNHLGKQVDLIRQYQQQGKQSIKWQPQGLPPGLYYFTLQAGEQVSTGKMVLIN